MTYTRAAAQELAMSAFLHLASDPELIGGFLAATGLQPQDLRQVAADPQIAVHVLDYLLEDDSRVIKAAAALNVPPAHLLGARTALAGPGSHGWEV